jgi:hypothetical protein
VNKKKQKNFFNRAVLAPTPPAQANKSFCAAFFKKRPLSLSDTSACSGTETAASRAQTRLICAALTFYSFFMRRRSWRRCFEDAP